MDYEERIGISRRRVHVSISLPFSMVELMDRIADSESAKYQQILERLVRKGLEVERAEREAKRKPATPTNAVAAPTD